MIKEVNNLNPRDRHLSIIEEYLDVFRSSSQKQIFRVQLEKERANDAGGGFRDILCNIVKELEDGSIPLLIKTQNHLNQVGENKKSYLLNPGAEAESDAC